MEKEYKGNLKLQAQAIKSLQEVLKLMTKRIELDKPSYEDDDHDAYVKLWQNFKTMELIAEQAYKTTQEAIAQDW